MIVNTKIVSSNIVRKLIPLKENKTIGISLPPFIAISHSKGYHIIPHSDILLLKSESNYTNIYLKNGQKILCSKTLKSIQDQLPTNFFCRVHRSYLIPLDQVRSVNTNPFTITIGEYNIPVNKDSKPYIKQLFLS